MLYKLARKGLDSAILDSKKQLLGDLYPGDDRDFEAWIAKYNDDRKDVGTTDLQRPAMRQELFQTHPAQWAIVEMAQPARGAEADQVEHDLQELEESGDPKKVAIAKAVRADRNKSASPYGNLPAEPTEDEALKYLENNYDPAFGLKGNTGPGGKQDPNWGKALDVVKQSAPHAYHFVFNVLNKAGHKPQRWQAAEPVLRTEPTLWPYYVWLTPGMEAERQRVPKPKTSQEIADERNNKGFSDKQLAEDVEQGQKNQQEYAANASAITEAYNAALKSSTQNPDLEKTIARDPQYALAYFEKVLHPKGWHSDVIGATIEKNRNSYDKADLEMYDNKDSRREKPQSGDAAEAAREGVAYAAKGKFFPELENEIAKDLGAIKEYVVKALKPNNANSDVISNALRAAITENPDEVIGILQAWGAGKGLPIYTEYITQLAGSDAKKATETYEKWKGVFDSDDLHRIMDKIKPAGPHIFPQPSAEDLTKIKTKLMNAWRK